jgi:outer membrane protein assembly factor BamB
MVTACLAKDGKEVWVFDSHKGFMTQFPRFALGSEHLYTATYSDGKGEFASTQYLYALNKTDGKVAWKVEQRKSNRKGPFFLEDKVYVTDWSGTSMSVNAKTGEVFAKRIFSDDCFPIADGVTLEIATAYDIKAGTTLWAAKPLPKGNALQNNQMAIPTVHGGRVYTDHHTGHVICIE